MRVLITGIAGLAGSHLADWILRNVPDCELAGIDDLSCGRRENIPKGMTFHNVSLGRGEWLDDVFTEPFDCVFHFAAHAYEGLSPFIRCYNYQNNLIATAEIVNSCIKTNVKRLVFTSSMAVVGRGVPPFDEDCDCKPIDPYGVAKLACERDIQIAGEQHGLDWCVIRPHNLYGPKQSLSQKYRNVFGIWMSRRLQGLPLLVYGDGRQLRAFSYIDDCIPCLWQAAVSPHASRQIINLGGRMPVTIQYAAEICAEVMGGADIQHVEPRHEVKEAWCTVEKSIELLGYEEATTLEDGLGQMWNWARTAKIRETKQPFEIEVEKGLYSYWR